MDTKYSTNPCKPTKLSAEAEEAWKDAKAEYERYTTEDLFESELFPTKKTEEEKLPF